MNLAVGVQEAKQARHQFTIQRQRGAGDGAAAERADIDARVAIPETLAIPLQHLDVSEQMMREINGLRALQVSVAGNDYVRIAFAERDERALQSGDVAEERDDFFAQPEAHVERHLIIARAAGVQFRAGGNPPGQLRLDIHMHVFEFGLPLELAGGDFPANLFQSPGNGGQLGPGQHTDITEHGRVGEGALEVVLPEPPVKGDGFGELGGFGGGTAGKASAAGNRG